MGRHIPPERVQRLQQIGRQPAEKSVLLEGVDHPNHRELADQIGAEEVTIEGHTIEPQAGAGLTATPDAEHDEGQHTGECPEGDLSAVLEHVGVLGSQQHPNNPPVQPKDPHQTRP